MLRKLLALCMLFVCLVSGAMAHGGKTDSKGGHTDRSTGQYHYHHGYSAHQHINGVCPYDFDDKTGESSGSPSTGSSSRATQRPTATLAPTPAKKEWNIMPIPIVSIVAVAVLIVIAKIISKKNEENTAARKYLAEHMIDHYEHILSAERSMLKIDVTSHVVALHDIAKDNGILPIFYKHHSLRDLAGVPDNTVIGEDGLPCDRVKETIRGRLPEADNWGETYTRYDSYGGTHFHTKTCKYADRPTNAYNIQSKTPCQYCRPQELPDVSWMDAYNRYKRECQCYGYTPQADNDGVREMYRIAKEKYRNAK